MSIAMKVGIAFALISLGVATSFAVIEHAYHPKIHTVAWFEANPSALKTTYQACDNDPGGVGRTGNCVNAEDAEAKAAQAQIWKDTPPPTVAIVNPFPNAGK